MTEHTKTPWKSDNNGSIFAQRRIVANCDGYRSNTDRNCHITNLANLEFIVTACNSHDELVAACETCLECFDSEPEDATILLNLARNSVEQALKKAKVK